MIQKVLILIAVAALVLSPTSFAKSVDELLRLAREDSLPEIRKAASLALTELWISDDQTNEQLEQIASEDVSLEVRSAAARTLGVRLAEAAPDQDVLLNLILTESFPEVQEEAANILSQRLLVDENQSLGSLTELASTSDNPRLQNAITPALARLLTDSPLSLEILASQINNGESLALQSASAQALIERLENSPIYTLEDDALFALVEGLDAQASGTIAGENAALQNAFGQLLQGIYEQSDLNLDQLIQLAGNPSEAEDVRKASAAVLSEKLLNANLPLDELEALARGRTPEIRNAVEAALTQAIVAALGRLELRLNELAASVADAGTPELAKARAEGVFVLLRTTLIRLEVQADLEALANGDTIEVNGITLDGSLEAYRLAASEFLTGIYSFFGLIDRFENPLNDLTVIAEDTSLAPEFRLAAANTLLVIYQAEQDRSLQTIENLFELLDQFDGNLSAGEIESATDSLTSFKALLDEERDTLILTSEAGGDFTTRQTLNNDVNRSITTIERALQNAQLLTIRSELALVRRNLRSVEQSINEAPSITDEQLIEMIEEGATLEIQQAASQALSQRWTRHPLALETLIDFATDSVELIRQAAVAALTDVLQTEMPSLDQLYQQALDGESFELRLAHAQALLPQLSDFDLEQAETLARGGSVDLTPFVIEGNSVQIQEAAAQSLIRVFSDESAFSIDDLLNLSVDGDNVLLQHSAASVLSQRWIDSDLSEGDLFVIASDRTLLFGPRPGSSEALSHALARALAHRLLINTPAPAQSGESVSLSSS